MNAKTKEAPTLTPITATIPEGRKGLALTGVPETWTSTTTLAVSPDGDEYAILCNNGQVYQGFVTNIPPPALAWGYTHGVKQKADDAGAGKDGIKKHLVDPMACKLTGTGITLDSWVSRAERAAPSLDPLASYVRSNILARLTTKGTKEKPSLGDFIAEKKVKLTGFSGGIDSLLSRYKAIVKEAMGMEPTEEQWETFTTTVKTEAQAEMDKAQANITASPFG